MSGDDREDRPRLTWREIDQRRSGGRVRDEEPRGPKAKRGHAQQTREALKDADSIFQVAQGGQEGGALAQQMRESHGSADFRSACRTYYERIGVPRETALLSLLLDSGDAELVMVALEALLVAKNAGSLQLGDGLKSQLRGLSQDRDDNVAGISEELLEDAG